MSMMNDIRVAKISELLTMAELAITRARTIAVEEVQAIINLPDNIENSEKNKARRAFAEAIDGDFVRLSSEILGIKGVVNS